MGLPLTAVRLIAPLLRGREVLCLGNPDLLITPETAKSEFGFSAPDHEYDTERGKAYKLSFPLVHTRSFFAFLGAKMYAVDFVPAGDLDQADCDLNEPHPELLDRFDLVVDPGTMEHCANVGQALMTAAGAVRGDGYVLHICPVSMINHGFYNMCPTLLRGFYEQNGWKVHYLGAFKGRVPFNDISWSVEWDHARVPMENNLAMLCLVQRLSETSLRWPVQQRWLTK